jgi:putative membrane protein (TIGR04086 family)
MGRSIGAVVFGFFVAFVWIFAIEAVNSICFPLPAGLDRDDRDAMYRYLDDKPVVLLGVVGAYFFGTFIGGWISGRTAKQKPILHGLIVGLVMFGFGVMNLLALPHPAWFWVVGQAMFPLGGALGGWVAGRTKAIPTPDLTR